jgi:hypothetical protein
VRVIVRIRLNLRSGHGTRSVQRLVQDDSGSLYGDAEALAQPRDVYYWVLCGMISLCFLAGIAVRPFLPGSSPAPTISLRAIEKEGKLLITWDAHEEQVRNARRASIEIQDGETTLLLQCGPECLASGMATYVPRSRSVDVRMQLFRPGSAPFQECTLFRGTPLAGDSTPEELDSPPKS